MNLYIHFPFCRSKCTYCALYSRVGTTAAARYAYTSAVADAVRAAKGPFKTIYFGGGSPGLCDLRPVFAALTDRSALQDAYEFTVELNPRDVTRDLPAVLRAGGVNRVSLGVQSLDDVTLTAMNRRHTAREAEEAFRTLRAEGFENAGVDLIAGWPGVSDASWRTTVDRILEWEPVHCSVYTLIQEPATRLDREVREGRVTLPDDDAALAQIDAARKALAAAGLARYEVSNYARPGFECRHNLAVWHGEDYLGLGSGAHGRIGYTRTYIGPNGSAETKTLSPEEDALERALFSLRLAEGLDLDTAARKWPLLTDRIPTWRTRLEDLAAHGIVRKITPVRFAPTDRGYEVCDAICQTLLD